MEPIAELVRPTGVDKFSEDLPGPRLPSWAEEHFARERAWHRLLRGTGAVDETAARAELARWMEG